MKLSIMVTVSMFILATFSGCGGGGGSMSGPSGPGDGGGGGQQPIGIKLSGVCLGPYIVGNPNSGAVVSESDLRQYLTIIALNFKSVRFYGSTGGLEKGPAIAKSLGLKVASGAWIGANDSANDKEIASLKANCEAHFVDVAVVGNEVFLRNDQTETKMLGYLSVIKATGVTTTIVEEWNALLKHPNIMNACDELWVNIYPFWEGVAIDQSMARFEADYNQVKSAAGGKKIVISETGWPSAGSANSAAIPTLENEAKYLANLVAWAKTNQVEYYLFEMFDEPWKSEPGGVGPNWGMWGTNLQLKAGLEKVFSADNTGGGSGGGSGGGGGDNGGGNLPTFIYTPIVNVPQAVNDLGKRICQEQRNIVTPGGTEWSPAFSSADQSSFNSSGKLATIVTQVKSSQDFTAGVASIKTLSAADQTRIFTSFITPLYSTWAMNGHVGSDGTTDAGYAVEKQISTALTNAVKEAIGVSGGDDDEGNLPVISYNPISSVPQAVNDLGKRICQEQRLVVTPGGNSWSPGFSSYDQSVFNSSGKLATIVTKVKATQVFTAGVASIRTLSADDQSRVFTSYQKPLYPTWAMNGHIGSDGTTDAGYAVEGQIAAALSDAVKAAL